MEEIDDVELVVERIAALDLGETGPLGVLACPALGQLRQRPRIALPGD